MARPLRLEFEGAFYHITSRGNRRESIYDSDQDRTQFLQVLEIVCERFNWICHAYCLMTNHYHLLIQTPDANLAKGMRHLNGVYTQKFNRHHHCVGHLFQGRYKAIVVDADAYLVELARYIVLNPVRAEIVDKPELWAWSSYLDTIGAREAPTWLEADTLLTLFGTTRASCIRGYIQFVADGIGHSGPWSELKGQIILGNERFAELIRTTAEKSQCEIEVPRYQRRPFARPLSEYERTAATRADAIRSAFKTGAYTMKQIADHFGIHYSTVSRIINS